MASGCHREYSPPPPLAPVVEAFWHFRQQGEATGIKRVLPDCCIDLIFDLSPEGRPFWVGTMTRPLLVSRARPAEFLGIRFRPGRASLFLNGVIPGLVDRRAGAAALGQKPVLALNRRLKAAPDLTGKLALVGDWLAREVREEPGRAEAGVALLDWLGRGGVDAPITAWAAQLGVSTRQLERIFLSLVGVSPRRFRSLLRFRRAVCALRGGAARPLDAVFAAGYYDQPHFARDFRKYSGLTPGQYLMSR